MESCLCRRHCRHEGPPDPETPSLTWHADHVTGSYNIVTWYDWGGRSAFTPTKRTCFWHFGDFASFRNKALYEKNWKKNVERGGSWKLFSRSHWNTWSMSTPTRKQTPSSLVQATQTEKSFLSTSPFEIYKFVQWLGFSLQCFVAVAVAAWFTDKRTSRKSCVLWWQWHLRMWPVRGWVAA